MQLSALFRGSYGCAPLFGGNFEWFTENLRGMVHEFMWHANSLHDVLSRCRGCRSALLALRKGRHMGGWRSLNQTCARCAVHVREIASNGSQSSLLW